MTDETTTTTPPADTTAPPPEDTTTTTPPADVSALTAQLAEMAATIEGLTTAKTEADAAAEAARQAALTDAEKAEEAKAALLGELETERQALAGERQKLVDDRRTAALERMGFDKRLHALAPAVDPGTVDGAAALEVWAKTHADLAKKTAATDAGPWTPRPKSMLSRVIAGEVKNPLISRDSMAKMFGGS